MLRSMFTMGAGVLILAALAGCDLFDGSKGNDLRGTSIATVSRAGLDAARKLAQIGGAVAVDGVTGLQQARLGDDVAGTPYEAEPPIAVYALRADSVAGLNGRPFSSLVKEPSYYLYPIRIGAQIGSCMRLDREGGDYVLTAIGGAKTIRRAIAERRALSSETRVLIDKIFFVEVPALNRMMAAANVSGKIRTFPPQMDSSAVAVTVSIDSSASPLVSEAANLGTNAR